MCQDLDIACASEKALVSIKVSINFELFKIDSEFLSFRCFGGGSGELNFKLCNITCMSQADCLPISVTLSIANGLDFPPMKCGWLHSPQLTHFSASVPSATSGFLSQLTFPSAF